MTRTRTRLSAALVSAAIVIAGGIAFASPAAAFTTGIDHDWQVLIGGTWTSMPQAPNGQTLVTNVPAGTQSVRFIVTNVGDHDAQLSAAWAGASNYNDPTGPGHITLANCPGFVDYATPITLPANGGSVTCTDTYNFLPGSRGALFGVQANYGQGNGGGYDFSNQGINYFGIDDSVQQTVLVADPSAALLADNDPSLQALPAGFTPQATFSFSNPNATEDLTGVTYSSTGTAGIATACPSLATIFVSSTHVGSGDCTVALAPASVAPKTVTITATGTGAFGPVVTTRSFTYAASQAACTVSATSFGPGDSGTVDCTGFLPGETLAATLNSAPVALGSVPTGAGTFSFAFTIPKGFAAGTHSLSFSLGGTVLLTTPAFIVEPQLASTGAHVALPVGIGVLLLGAGAIFLLYRRRSLLR